MGAPLVVVARSRCEPLARALDTGVTDRAGVAVIAVTVERLEDAPGLFVAQILCAWIGVITRHGRPGCAHGLLAGVSQSTRLAVVARGEVRREAASCGRCAGVVGALVAVIARRLLSDARAGDALVIRCARIVIVARAPVEHLVNTAALPPTSIKGARVTIITGHVVCVAVTVVIDTVADVLLWSARVALRETLGGARSEPLARAVFVGHAARRGQAQIDGQRRARADPFFTNALQARAPAR